MMADRKAKDSMKSTWRLAPKSTWGPHHHLIEFLRAHPTDLSKPIPVHDPSEPIPHLPQWSQLLWVTTHALLPIALHQLYLSATGARSLGLLPAFNLYFLAFNAVVVREIQILRRLAHTWGFLDGAAHPRDGVPDAGVDKVASSLYKTTGSRILLTLLLTYSPSDPPPLEVLSSPRWWAVLALQVGLYAIVLDFWFYWYHRAMHTIGPLWRYHRTHHLTKHPNALLTAYADHEQEVFDMVAIPLLTYLTLAHLPSAKLDFYAWWICHQFVVYTEVWGHSGLRVHLVPPSTATPLLCLLGAEIVVEDHDLHHRKGYRVSHNYGKQTRLWDRIFGTCAERIESREGNVDYVNVAHMPIF